MLFCRVCLICYPLLKVGKRSRLFFRLNGVIEMEGIIRTFYLGTAKAAKLLMANVPVVFERIARKRNERQLELKKLLNAL